MKALKNKVQVVLTGLAMILVVATAEAVDYKIGVVNVQKVLTSIPQTEAATKKLEKEFGSRDRDIGTVSYTHLTLPTIYSV